MRKFELTASSLLHEPDPSLDGGAPLVSSSSDFHRPVPASSFPRCLLSPPICPDFAGRFLAGRLTDEECRVVGFREQTSRPELIERTVLEVAGTVLTAQLALRHGVASNVAGGTHHATRDRARGYTILNDLATAVRLMTWDEDDAARDGTGPEDLELLRGLYRGESPVERVLVVDTDVHQGDGTATFHNGPGSPLAGRLFTLDLHASRNYPARKEECTYSVGLPDGTDDDGYLDALAGGLDRAIDEVRPDLVLYNAGVDVHERDRLGRLSLTTDGIRRRDMHVVRTCRGAGLPVACTVGGGYSDDPGEVAARHAIVHRVCAEVWREEFGWV
ncbi:hypothetical protein THAOC_06153 [Thalassiosira oceanica]|uniref:Histone deacetylase domain-containing protein n=1 Tax=Thalassiosira oceanica TaxID=159749 RepID=K0TFH6_THAOC|nr:hypothetical protein THAOC_06153 [Thalassiosira oceanica]|eukprot:EJK72326.1 hypothetical protein THAOC_06153 [Thalassiosira oceanica]